MNIKNAKSRTVGSKQTFPRLFVNWIFDNPRLAATICCVLALILSISLNGSVFFFLIACFAYLYIVVTGYMRPTTSRWDLFSGKFTLNKSYNEKPDKEN